MKSTKLLEYALGAVLLVLLASILSGILLGYSVPVTFVESGSMEPTIREGDGFIALPTALVGSPSVGDVVLFRAEQVQGGRPTTHRIVDERPDGFITQGDANLFPDQSAGEPPVTEAQVKAIVVTVGDDVLRLPHLGTAVGIVGGTVDTVERTVAGLLGVPRIGGEQLAYLLFGVGLVAFAASLLLGDSTGRTRDRSTERSGRASRVFDTRYVLVASILILCVGATVGMVAPGGTQTFGIVSSEGDSANPTIVPVGGSDAYEWRLHNGGFVPTVSYLEPRGEGIQIDPGRVQLAGNESANATVTLFAPDETGYYLRSKTEHRYLLVLPASAIDALYEIHPWAPYAAINATIAIVLSALWTIANVPTEVHRRPRSRARPTDPGDRS